MNNKILAQALMLTSFLFSGCFAFKGDKFAVQTTITNKKVLNATLTTVNVANDQVTITGTGFSNISSVKLQGNGVDAILSVDSKSDTQIIARATSALSLLVNGTFNLIIGTVEADATYPITFTLQNGAIQAVHLSQMGADSGQVLKWNGAAWAPASLTNSQIYLGNWNAATGSPDITNLGSFQNGDYLIVTTAGTYSSSALVTSPTTFAIGDWVMFNGTKWDRIDNTSNVVGSFQGRRGTVTLQASDYVSLKDTTTHKLTGSSINDLADINLTVAPTDGQILKWDAATSKWLASDDLTSGGVGSVSTAEIANGAVTYAKMTINDGDLPVSKLVGASDSTKYLRGDKTWQTLNSDAVTEGATNLYFSNSRVLDLAITGFTATNSAITATDSIVGAFGKTQGQINSLASLGSSYLIKNDALGDSVTGQVIINAATGSLKIPATPSGVDLTDAANVQYVKNYADLKLPLTGGTLTGDLQANTKIKFQDGTTNTAAIKAPTTITSSYILTLPTGLGSANQVLTTDASGVLSWSTPSTTATPSGAAGGDLAGTYPNPTLKTALITDSHIATTLSQSKITNLVSDLASKASSTLTSGYLFVGNSSNVTTGVALSGDATLTNNGALTLNTVGVAKGGTGLTSGTSGGIPYYSSSSAMTSSGVLASNGVMLGGGAGVAPSTTAVGTSNQILSVPAAGGAPAFGSIDLSTTATVGTSILPIANGGTGAASVTANYVFAGPTSIGGAPTFRALASGDLPSGTVSGSGTTNYVPYYSATTTLANSPIVISGSNVGIGTTSPAVKLDVVGAANFDGPSSTIWNVASGRTRGIVFQDIASDGRMKMGHSDSIGSSSIDFWHGGSPITLTNVQASTMTLTGIPKLAATGNGAGGDTSLIAVNSGSGTGQRITLQTAEHFGSDTNVQPNLTLSANSFLFSTMATGSRSWSTLNADSPAMSILNSGYVGIGTTSPTTGTRLDITGSGATASSIIIPRDTVANRPTTGVNGMIRYASDTNKFEAYENGAWTNVISTSGTPSGAASGDLSGTYPSPTISGLAATKIGSGTVSNTSFGYLSAVTSDIQAQLNAKTTSTLASTNIFVGNGSNVATAVALSGDATLANTGALTLNTVIVAKGGTGATTLTSNGILYGNGTSAVGATAAATTPSVLLSTVTTNEPAWTTSTAGNFLQGSVTGAVFAPITNISPGTDFTITQNSVVPFTSVNSGAVVNTLYLKAGNVGIGTTSPAVSLDLNSKTDSIRVPAGTTAQRPGTPANGDIRYNSTLGTIEGYMSSAWTALNNAIVGRADITSTPYTITSSQAGVYFSYNNAATGVINLPSLASLSDGWQMTIMRKVAQSVTITPNGADAFANGITTFEMQGNNLQSVTITKNGSNWAITNKTDDCILGQSCWATGLIYAGLMNGHQYFTTPGGCTNSSTPTCAGGTDATTKAWANNSGTTAYNVLTAATNTDDGQSQSATLATTYTDTDAAKFCESMSYAGYSDWYLPAKAEFNLIYQNKATIKGFSSNYWTSTDLSTTSAYNFQVSAGYFGNGSGKSNVNTVRCVRRF